MEFVAYDDVFSVLKNGASALWSVRHDLFPGMAPIIDKAISTAKNLISNISGPNLSNNLKKALISDHSGFSQNLNSVAQKVLQNYTKPPIVSNLSEPIRLTS